MGNCGGMACLHLSGNCGGMACLAPFLELTERTNWGKLLEPDYVSGKDLGRRRHDPSQAPADVVDGKDEQP